MRRRTWGLLAAGAMLAVAAVPTAASGASSSIVWGATVRYAGTQTQIDAVHAFESKVGRSLGATRVFLAWDSPFPTSYENALKADGTVILLSFSTRRVNGTGVSWASIAAAKPGSALYSDMKSWADRVRDFGVPIYVTMQHEPEASVNTSRGTADEYVAAWRVWVDILRAEGATNAKAMWITTAYAHKVGANDRRQASKWYPGNGYVDAMAVDAYNWSNCRPGIVNPWTSLQALIEGFRTFSLTHPGPELWLAEYGSVEDPTQPDRRANWINDAAALMQTPNYGRFRGVVYFDLNKPPCDWRVDAFPKALAAFKAMGLAPYYSG